MPFVAFSIREIQRVQGGDVTQLIARDVSNTWPLDFQDIGPEPRKQLRARWSGLHAGEVDDFDSFEWQLHDKNFLIPVNSTIRAHVTRLRRRVRKQAASSEATGVPVEADEKIFERPRRS